MFSAFTLTVGAAGNDPFISHGQCGRDTIGDVEYYVFDDGSIAFFPTGTTGAIKDYAPAANGYPTAPWYDLGNQLTAASFQSTKISIESGITAIGAYDFYLPSELTGMLRPMLRTGSIELPDSLTSIGAHAFENQMKLEKITLPSRLTSIGTDAFKGCTMLYGVDYYGNPNDLTWYVGTAFSQLVTLHVKPIYADQLDTLNQQYQPYNITVEANLHSTIESDGVERNINIAMGQENSGVFGGAVPFVIVGTFSGQKKSVTYGSNGFASAVRIGTDESNYQYYIHENNNTKNLYAPVLNSSAGYVESLNKNQKCPLQLELSHEYIGTNIVKVIYTLSNPSDSQVDNICLGSAGDIKIGADDYATIKPLMENNEQTGFYMSSTNDYDKVGDNSATLGFIGKGVKISENNTSAPATFFYGPVFANANQSSTGVFRHRLLPKRIFDHTGTAAVDHGNMPATEGTSLDSGMSYFWNVGSIEPDSYKECAVLFSVYGADTTKDDGQEMVAEKTKTYHTVTWDYNFDGDNDATTNSGDSYKMLVEHNAVTLETIPFYPAETPHKPREISKEFIFSKWTDSIGNTVTESNMPVCSGSDMTFYAEYTEKPEIFFKGHSLTLQGDIGIYFYVNVAAAGITPEQIMNGNHSISFSFAWKTTPAPYTDLSVDNVTLDRAYCSEHPEAYDSEKRFFKIKCNTAVAEMSCIVHASAIVKNSLGATVYSDSDDYSVRDYALTIINDESTYGTNLVNLSKAMLDYGAKAQVVFGIATGSPANAGVEYSMTPVTADDIENAIKAANGNQTQSTMTAGTAEFGCDYAGSTIMFLTKTSIRLYYTVSNQGLFDEKKLAYITANSNNPNAFRFSAEKDPYMMFELSNIHAKDLDVLQTFTIAGQTYLYSVLDYSKNILRYGTNNDDRALAQATYWYNHYTNIYFGA